VSRGNSSRTSPAGSANPWRELRTHNADELYASLNAASGRVDGQAIEIPRLLIATDQCVADAPQVRAYRLDLDDLSASSLRRLRACYEPSEDFPCRGALVEDH
jgi:hypothetical protein